MMVGRIWLSTLALLASTPTLQAFALTRPPPSARRFRHFVSSIALPLSSSAASGEGQVSDEATSFEPIFDFRQNSTVEKFERIDDAIMGGISTSAVRNVPGEHQQYASWSGVCRIDGGGFCGMRTLAFEEPILASPDAEGFFVDCRLTSDDEPQRRVWKMTTRSERSRGEELYQAQFTLPNNTCNNDEFTRVLIPFSDFKLVRGPRMVVGAAPLNATGGLYQIGLSLSKFQISRNMTEIENFRPGYFELQLQAIGLYSNVTNGLQQATITPSTLSPTESKRKRPLIVKILFPVIGLLFSEDSRRRRSAMKLLMEERGMSRAKAIVFGIRKRSQSYGMPRSLLSFAVIVFVDSLRSIVRTMIFFPIRVTALLLGLPGKLLKTTPKHTQEHASQQT